VKNIPLLLKQSLILMSIMLISMAILVWFSVSNILNFSEQEIAGSSLAETKANRELTDEVMENIVENSVRLASSKIFDKIRNIRSISDLNNNISNIRNATSIQTELVSLNKINTGIYSSFFYLEGTDYVVSTDRGITALKNYENIDWMDVALESRKGIKGVWYSRWDEDNKRSVMSYVISLNSLNTATKGTLVVNINETQFNHYLSSEQAGFNEYLLINEDGYVISHLDSSMLFSNLAEDEFFSQLLSSRERDGHTFRELDGKRQLVTWSRSSQTDWLTVNIYELEKQMEATFRMQKSITVLAILMLVVGCLLALIVTKRLSKPIQKLVMMVNTHLNQHAKSSNELQFLEEAFQRMQDEEAELHRLLGEREKDAKVIAVQHLIRGEITDQIRMLFNKEHFLVVLFSIDAYRKYSIKNSRETRSFHRYKWITEVDQIVIEDAHTKCIYQGDGYYVLIINTDDEKYIDHSEELKATITQLQHKAQDIFHQSVSISISAPSSSHSDVNAQYLSAFEAMKRRMLHGNGSVHYWLGTILNEQKNFYSAVSEKKILSAIDQADFEKVKQELSNIRHEISVQEDVSPDSVLFVSHQLVGATIKHLREKNVNLQRLFSSNKNIYTHLAMAETLDDIEHALVGFCEDIINYLIERTEGEGNQYGDKILQYLQNNYRTDIVFEDMAKEIGISYSYMRKLIIEMTGMSLIDYVHSLRIKQAKELLRSTQLTIAQIAEEVGYNNIRSFNRFFQKIENMTPSVYRSEQSKVIETVE